MKWRIRKAKIPEKERRIFERYGVTVIGLVLSGGLSPAPSAEELHPIYTNEVVGNYAAQWLKEQHDRAERRETWLITMEAAITLFVFSGLVFSVLNFLGIHYR